MLILGGLSVQLCNPIFSNMIVASGCGFFPVLKCTTCGYWVRIRICIFLAHKKRKCILPLHRCHNHNCAAEQASVAGRESKARENLGVTLHLLSLRFLHHRPLDTSPTVGTAAIRPIKEIRAIIALH